LTDMKTQLVLQVSEKKFNPFLTFWLPVHPVVLLARIQFWWYAW